MTSTRPYLLRAFYDWIIDNHCTPYIVVNAEFSGVTVPEQYVEGGQIVLNVAMTAVQGLKLGDEAVEFQARFGGKVRHIYAPLASILAIYAKENGKGMVFTGEELEPPPEPPIDSKEEDKDGTGSGSTGQKGKGARAHLTLVK